MQCQKYQCAHWSTINIFWLCKTMQELASLILQLIQYTKVMEEDTLPLESKLTLEFKHSNQRWEFKLSSHAFFF
jgi:hypothetical protein